MENKRSEFKKKKDIAIVGISCMLPGANNLDEFWDNMINGVESISEIDFERWNEDFFSTNIDDYNKSSTKWLGQSRNLAFFDNQFFNMSPAEANNCDPQQRIALQETWKCIEDAAIPISRLQEKRTAVMTGAAVVELFSNANMTELEIDRHTISGSFPFFIPNRVSNYFGFNGESLLIDTGCSSSAVAFHEAVQSLQMGNSDYAIVTGINVIKSPSILKSMSKMGLFSKNGKCSTFDADANGIVVGEGVVTLLLTTVEEAEKNQNHIYSLVKHVMVNHVGNTGRLVAPSVASQYDLIMSSWKNIDFNPETITYAELHGTGTRLGDPIEVEALRKSYESRTEDKNFCYIGSVKPNIGHLLGASGLVGVAKVIQMMKHKMIPKQININKVNPLIDLENSPFMIPMDNVEWKSIDDKTPLRASIMSIGLAGVNGYTILEEYKGNNVKSKESLNENPYFILSAKSKESLKALIKTWKNNVEQIVNENELSDVLYTLSTKREQFDYRVITAVTDQVDFIEKIHKMTEDDIFEVNNQELSIHLSSILEQPIDSLVTMIQSSQSLSQQLKSIQPLVGKEAYQFVVQHVVLDGILRATKNVNKISVDSIDSLLHALVLTKAITLNDCCDYIQHKKPIQKVEVKQINKVIQLSDKSRFETNLLNERYLNYLFGQLSFEFIEEATVQETIWHEQFRKLYRSQRAYRKYVEEMCDTVSEWITKEEILAFIQEDNRKLKDEPNQTKQFIYVILLSLARIRLNRKWSLEYSSLFQDTRIEEICNLILEQFSTLDELTKQFVKRKEYRNNETVEFEYTLQEVEECCKNALFAHTSEAISGELRLEYTDTSQFIDLMMELWKQGAIVEWEACMEYRFCKGISLPTYCFQNNKYRIIYQENYSGEKDNTAATRMLTDSMAIKVRDYKSSPVTYSNQSLDHLVYISNQKDGYIEELANQVNYVRFSNEYHMSEQECTIRCNVENDYVQMIQEMERRNPVDTIVVDIANKEGYQREQYIEYTYLVAIQLAKAFTKVRLKEATKVLFVYSNPDFEIYAKAMTALFKTIHMENENLYYRIVYIEETDQTIIPRFIQNEVNAFSNGEYVIQYKNGQRISYNWTDCQKIETKSLLKEDGVYLIIGGTGGIGKLLSNYLASNKNTTIILTGRRDETDSIKEQITQLSNQCKEASYRKTDITNREELEKLIQDIIQEYGHIHGIFHLAATLRQGFFELKDTEYLRSSIRTKVDAMEDLDEITKHMNLDFLCMFSSISSVIGDYGLCEYVYANCYMDEFVEKREALRVKGQRNGYTISINWPFWADGGLTMDEADTKRFGQTTGMYPMPTAYALRQLDKILSYQESGEYCIVYGDAVKIKEHLKRQITLPMIKSKDMNQFEHTIVEQLDIRTIVEHYFIEILSKELGLAAEDYDTEETFENYGVDSILIHKINRILTNDFKDISTTMLFDCINLDQVVDYILDTYDVEQIKASLDMNDISVEDKVVNQRVVESVFVSKPVMNVDEEDDRDIAIIGMSGRFPKAQNLEEYWNNLLEGVDCITEIPKDRWDIDRYYDKDSSNSFLGMMDSRWGGFVDQIDQFDPYLFRITPADAKGMDPQERMLLEIVYEALEYAGYSKTRLQETIHGKVGVFVGSTINGYRLLVEDEYMKGNFVPHNAMPWSIANRISYCFELNGPSYTIDSACSSSLNAVVAACQNIREGSCKMAIVGGTNLHVHPSEYILRSQLRVMSPTGRCYTFSDHANGYVPGEGVGAVVLKSLKAAKQDKDRILGVIKGVGTNHVGHPSGYTVPSSKAQAEVITSALQDAKMAASEVSLIEAHGTGTKLGDPIEINGLTEAFRNDTKDNQVCAISSVKSNIGHLEGASGVAALIKVLLQLRHKTKVPSLHCNPINKGIHFEATPFYVQEKAEPWVSKEGHKLTAGISSFGAGGANAHIIVQEYSDLEMEPQEKAMKEVPVIISAMTKDSLIHYVDVMIQWLQNANARDESCEIQDIAYTTQIGRELLPYRMAVLCRDTEQLLDELQQYKNNSHSERTRYSYPEQRTKLSKQDRKAMELVAQESIKNQDMNQLINCVLEGCSIQWNQLNETQQGRIILLPSYCFDNERFWIDVKESKGQEQFQEANKNRVSYLLDENVSNINAQRFTRIYHIDEEFVRDHVISGSNILAGVVQLEMAFEAGNQTFVDQKVIGVENLRYLRGIYINEEPVEVLLEIEWEEDEFVFRIYQQQDTMVLCTTGVYCLEEMDQENRTIEPIKIDTTSLQGCNGDEYYERLRTYGFEFQDTFRSIQHIYNGEYEVIGIVDSAPQYEYEKEHGCVLWPQQVDGALQTVFELIEDKVRQTDRFIPTTMGSIQLYGEISKTVISVATLNTSVSTDENEYHFDVRMYSEQGILLIEILDYTLTTLRSEEQDSSISEEELLMELFKRVQEGNIDRDLLLQLLQK